MRVAVLGSGSSGNAVLFSAAGTSVLVDAGLSARELVRRARALDVDLGCIAALVLTHEHGDHARGAAGIVRLAGCPVYASTGTLGSLGGSLGAAETVPIEQLRPIPIGPLVLTACRTPHDAAEPMAVALSGPGAGERVGLACDIGRATAAVRYLLRESACLIVEANHDEVMLRTGPYPASVRRRIAGSAGHLSNRAAGDLVAELWHPGLETVVLAHVSDNCNRPDLAEEAVGRALAARGFTGRLLVARRGEVLPAFNVGPIEPAAVVPAAEG